MIESHNDYNVIPNEPDSIQSRFEVPIQCLQLVDHRLRFHDRACVMTERWIPNRVK